MVFLNSMTFLFSFIISVLFIFFLSLFYKEEAFFWLEKFRIKRKKKKFAKNEKNLSFGRKEPIKKYCGFRDWSDEGGEICTLFEHEDGAEYMVTEEICQKCLVWARYEEWLSSDKKKDFSVTLAHTMSGSEPMVVETDKYNPEMESGLKFSDFVIKRKRVPWAGKAAIAVLTLITYLMVYFSGVFTNPVVLANPDIFYFYDEGDKADTDAWNMRTTNPSSADNLTTKCDNQSVFDTAKACILDSGDTSSIFEIPPTTITKKGWMTDDDDLLDGTMPAGNFIVYVEYYWNVRTDCTFSSGELWWRLYKGSSDLSSSTELFSWNLLCNMVEDVADSTCSDTVNKGSSTTFNNEVLYVEFYTEVNFSCDKIDSAPNGSIYLYVDGGTTQKLDTPTYAPIPENSLYLAFVVPFLPVIIKKFKLKDYLKKK